MPELIAEGPEPRQRWKLVLQAGREYILGRDPGADLAVPWDPCVSRRHLRLCVGQEGVVATRLPDTANALFWQGRAVETCTLQPGDHFVVGSTSFAVLESSSAIWDDSAKPVEEVTFSRQALQHVRFRDPDKRVEVLSHLPEVITGSRTEPELHLRLVNLLLAGIAQSEAAAIVAVDPADGVRVYYWDRRHETAGAFRPSARLVTEALVRRGQSVLHVWESSETQEVVFTATQEFDWAFCTPVKGPGSERWGLYLAGEFIRSAGADADGLSDDGAHLQADVKFAELVAEIVSSVQKVNALERQQAGLRQFFPPVLLSALGDDLDTALLTPRESDVTVLFCDFRGFSRQAEESRDDLIGLLDRVSQALGVMTRHILEFGGVIGDFQGDAAMGFWGWPVESPDGPLQACRAALAIRKEFAATVGQAGHPLADFEMGMGMAHGRAVAGKIGTSEHVKVTVFGPVVNLASRLEGMTKQLRVPILIDEALAEIVRAQMLATQGRTRRLARVQPYGMEASALVSELLPGTDEASELTSVHLAAYENAVEHFIAGRWDAAYRSLRELPSSDRAQDFLAMLIAQHGRVAPPDWNGVVRLESK